MYRCPYCHNDLEPPLHAVCPHCGKAMVLPGPPVDEVKKRREAKERIRFEAERERKALGGRTRRKRRGARTGLILVVMFVLGTILVMKTQLDRGQVAGGRYPELNAEQELTVLRVALERFKDDNGRYPTEREGLLALVHDPGVPHWRGPYITILTPDPWQQPYHYSLHEGDPQPRSMGRDGVLGTDDDPEPSDWELLYEEPRR